MFSKSISIIARSVQLLFAIVVLSLSANIIANSYWNDTNLSHRPGNPGAVNYPVFIGIFTILCSIFYLLEAYWDLRGEDEDSRYATLGLDALNTIFWFTGAVALSALMGVHSCSNETYTRTNVITRDAANTKRRCQEAQATTAFLWFGFLTFVLTTVAAGLYITQPALVLHQKHEARRDVEGAPPVAVSTPNMDHSSSPPQPLYSRGNPSPGPTREQETGYSYGNSGGMIGDP